jgi:photosystem II stability/assembly factor-like uncharacterized protein
LKFGKMVSKFTYKSSSIKENMKKYSLVLIVAAVAAVLSILLTNEKSINKKFKYPSEREFIQRTYPYYEYDPSAYLTAIKKTHQMKDVLRKQYLSKGISANLWEFAGPVNIGGRVVDIEFNPLDPTIVYAAAATGGVFKSTDTGETWFPIFDDQSMLSIGDIAVDPVNPDIIYAGTGEANGGHNNFPGAGVFKSTNAGNTWTHIGLDSTASIGRIIINYNDPQEIYLAAVGSYFSPNPQRGVYKSTDGGTTWSKSLFISDSTGAIDIVMHPSNPNWLMAAMWERVRRPNLSRLYGRSSGIYRSTNGGTTWELLDETKGLPNADVQNVGRIGLAISKSNPQILFALYNDGSSYSGLYKTTNGGNSWVDADPDKEIDNGSANFSWFFGQVRVHPSDPNIVYAMDVGFMKSSNSGTNWNVNWETHVDHHALAFHPQNPNYVILGNDGGINISTNAGDSWSDAKLLPITQFYEIGLDLQNPERLYGGTQDNNTVRTATGGLYDWENLLGGDGFYVIVDPLVPQIIYAEWQYGGLSKSIDGGFTWEYIMNGVDPGEPINWSMPVIMCPFDNNTLYLGTNRIYRSTNAGNSWTAISGDLTKGIPGTRLGTVTTIAVSMLSDQIIYAGTDDAQLWITTNKGNNWTKISEGLPDRWITRVVPDVHNIEKVYVTFSGLKWRDPQPHIYKSTNIGADWINISGNLPDAPVNAFAVDYYYPGRLFAGLDVGAFVSFNDGNSWTVLGEGLPVVSVYDMKIHLTTNYLAAGTHGRSMYKIDLNTLIDPSAVEDDNPVISEFSLSQNYPNPFNPETMINYRLTGDGIVELKVYDITGKEAGLLVNEYQTAGEYNIAFKGEYLASGVYIYRLKSGDRVLTRKMILMK